MTIYKVNHQQKQTEKEILEKKLLAEVQVGRLISMKTVTIRVNSSLPELMFTNTAVLMANIWYKPSKYC